MTGTKRPASGGTSTPPLAASTATHPAAPDAGAALVPPARTRVETRRRRICADSVPTSGVLGTESIFGTERRQDRYFWCRERLSRGQVFVIVASQAGAPWSWNRVSRRS